MYSGKKPCGYTFLLSSDSHQWFLYYTMLMGSLLPSACCGHPPNLSQLCFTFRDKHRVNVKWMLKAMATSFIFVETLLLNGSIQIYFIQDQEMPLCLWHRSIYHFKSCPEREMIVLSWKNIQHVIFSLQFCLSASVSISTYLMVMSFCL